MSIKTTFTAHNVIIFDQEITNKGHVEQLIESNAYHQHKLQAKILALACATPADIAPRDEHPLTYITDTLNDILGDYTELIADNERLHLLLNNWDTYQKELKN